MPAGRQGKRGEGGVDFFSTGETISPKSHLYISSGISFLLYLYFQSVAGAIGFIIGGVLIDLDHFLEFFRFSGKKFTFKNFIEFFDLLEYKKAYVFFHSYEILLIAGAVIAYYSESFIFYGLILGMVIHMLLDIIGNPVYFKGYFLLYRIFTGFERGKFIDVEKHFRLRDKRIASKNKNNKNLNGIILFFAILFFASSCAVTRNRLETPYQVYREKGIASWYGEDFNGRPTSSGEIYDMYGLTAAHKTLPLQTKVHVTNIMNGKSVDVKINDRGPFVNGRIIDLSYGAAKVIDMVEAGVTMVNVEVIDGNRDIEDKIKEGIFTVQVGSFAVRENAEKLTEKLNKEYGNAYITLYETNSKKFNRVRVGNFKTLEEAQKFAKKLEKENYSTFVARKD